MILYTFWAKGASIKAKLAYISLELTMQKHGSKMSALFDQKKLDEISPLEYQVIQGEQLQRSAIAQMDFTPEHRGTVL